MSLAWLADALREERDAIVDAVLDRRREIPTYALLEGTALEDVKADGRAIVDTLCDALEHDRALVPEDLAFLSAPIARRAVRGDSLADVARGLQLLQNAVYERVGALSRDPAAALAVGGRLLELIDVATAVAGAAWSEGRSTAPEASLRSQLLELLLAGRAPDDESLRQLARRLGLVAGAGVVVVSAGVARDGDEPESPAAVIGALSRAGGPVELPLASADGGEIVVVHVAPPDPAELVGALERAWRRLADRGIRLAVGVSARHVLPGGARDAVEDARHARDAVPAGGGIVALPTLAALDWMAIRADATTWQLVPERVRAFVEQDAADGGQLLHTLRGYIASDLNIKLAARRLHMHTNTVRYRLGRIGERTGLDLRRLDDVIALHVALRLFDAQGL